MPGQATRRELAVTERRSDRADAPLVVLVHGAMDRARSLRRVVERLTDLHVVVYDRRGYGDSLGAGPPSGLDQHAADLLDVIGPRRATVVGHSLGSHVAVLAAIRGTGQVAGVGLWEPPVPWMDFWPNHARQTVAAIASSPDPGEVGERGMRAMIGADAWDRLPEETQAQRRAEGVAFVVDMASEIEAPFAWADLRVPCVIGYGEDSWPYSVKAARRLAEMVGCPTVMVEGAPHTAHASHPDGFADFVRRAVDLT